MPVDPEEPDADLRVVAAAAQLYAVAPADFVARRAVLVRQARQDGAREAAREIGGLRRPSVAAWAVNHLVRHAPEVVDALTEVGEALRAAQTRLAADELKALRGERDRALRDLVTAVRDAAADAGQRLSPSVLDEVHASAVAALADPAAAEALASGTLTRALSYSGFGEVDLADAVARTGTGVPLAVIRGGLADARGTGREPSPGQDADRREGERRRVELALARAEREHAAAEAALDAARTASESARQALAAARDQLARAQADDEARLFEVSEAAAARRAAQQALTEARRAAQALAPDDRGTRP